MNTGSAKIFYLLLSLWTVERLNPSSAYARDFANAVSGKVLQKKSFERVSRYLVKLISIPGKQI